MIGRRTSSLFASLLVLAQLLVGPVAHPAPAGSHECVPPDDAIHHESSGTSGCDDCPDSRDHTADDSHSGDHPCRSHLSCSCPCAHTPALGAFQLPVASPTPPEPVISALTVPAPDAPLFDFLRPPN